MPDLNLKQLDQAVDIGDSAGASYTRIETTGFLEATGSAIAYRDEYPSFDWLPAGGKASPDLANHVIGGVDRRVYVFDGGSTEERLSSCFEIPHDYAYGLPIEVHMHFRPTDNSAGDVKFFFDWEYSGVNNSTAEGYNNPPQAQTSLTMIETIPSNSQYYQVIRAFGDLPDLGFELGDKIGFNIRRTPSDVEDTYNADVILEQVALHIPVNTNGSRQRYVK